MSDAKREEPDDNAVDSWIASVVALVSDEAASARVAKFLQQSTARRVIGDWIIAETLPEMAQTDMSDVYKISMVGVFALIQRRLNKDLGTGAFKVTFTLNVRPSSEFSIEEVFRRSIGRGAAGSAGSRDDWVAIRDSWLLAAFALTRRPFDLQVLRLRESASPSSSARHQWRLRLVFLGKRHVRSVNVIHLA